MDDMIKGGIAVLAAFSITIIGMAATYKAVEVFDYSFDPSDWEFSFGCGFGVISIWIDRYLKDGK